jgi:hypothetical protein
VIGWADRVGLSHKSKAGGQCGYEVIRESFDNNNAAFARNIKI